MKLNKSIEYMMMAAAMLTATSCSDFSDYNDVKSDVTSSANQTLWQNIQANPELSDFASLIQKSGFSDNLNQSHYYTVWAPLNGTFNVSDYSNLSTANLLKQFVYNHIADYGHYASGTIDERVKTINKKSYSFTGSSSYTFDERTVTQTNLPSNNGVMHVLNGNAMYFPNIYDYVTDKSLNQDKGIDSISSYFKRYEHSYLDTKSSVVGPIVNGLQTYIDSVMVTYNLLSAAQNANLGEEDSTYTMLIPTNKAWNASYNKIKACYNYIATTKAESFVTSSGTVTISSTPLTKTVDNVYLKDSLTRLYLIRNLVFSNSNKYNVFLKNQTTPTATDTLYSTTHDKLSNPADMLSQQVAEVKMSNGIGKIVDSLAINSWESYSPELQVAAYKSNNRARVVNGSVTNMQMHDSIMSSTGVLVPRKYYYSWIAPTGGYAKPELDMYLPNVLSTTYNIYCVFAPMASGKTLPNRVIFTLSYCDASGALKSQVFYNTNEDSIASFKARFPKVTDKATINAFSNNIANLPDTMYVGQFTFPVCYKGLNTTDAICPNIKITSPFPVFNKDLMAAYQRDFCIAAIILKPVELVEHENANKSTK